MSYKTIVFWWNNACRSVMPLFRECAAIGTHRVRVVVEEALDATRTQMGWTADIDSDLKVDVLPKAGWEKVVDRILREEKDSLHVIGGYLAPAARRYAAIKAAGLGVPYCVMAESPLNMESGLKWIAKEAYIKWGVPKKGKGIIDNSRYFFCLSGERIDSSLASGWPVEKVYSFGYFPKAPSYKSRGNLPDDEPVRIISMGYLSRYKGNHVLLDALSYLKRASKRFVCEIVGAGDQLASLRLQSQVLGISDHVNFHGFVSDDKLQSLLSVSDILCCPGLDEPWGIRINEGIHLGMAVVASDRLGASDILNSTNCGAVFRSGCAGELFLALNELVGDRLHLARMKARATVAGHLIAPERAAKYFLDIVSRSNGAQDKPPAIWHEVAADLH